MDLLQCNIKNYILCLIELLPDKILKISRRYVYNLALPFLRIFDLNDRRFLILMFLIQNEHEVKSAVLFRNFEGFLMCFNTIGVINLHDLFSYMFTKTTSTI